MPFHCSSVLLRCVQYYIFFAVGLDGCQSFPHLWRLFRENARRMPSLAESCIQTWNTLTILTVSRFLLFLTASPRYPFQWTQCTWLNPLLIMWNYGCCSEGGGPCQPHDFEFVTVECCVELTKSLAVSGRGTAVTLSCILLSWAGGSCRVMLSAFLFVFILPVPCLLSPCTPPSTNDRQGSPKSAFFLKGQHKAHHPFYLLCLSCVCSILGLFLDPQGRVFVLLTKAYNKSRAAFRNWGWSEDQLAVSISNAQAS